MSFIAASFCHSFFQSFDVIRECLHKSRYFKSQFAILCSELYEIPDQRRRFFYFLILFLAGCLNDGFDGCGNCSSPLYLTVALHLL